MIHFDMPHDRSSIIKVIGIGGGGCNAVNHMYNQGIKDVDFVICNTDSQSLEFSQVPNQIRLGPELTRGRGAGSHPETGKEATIESMIEIRELLESGTEMVFVTAGMGGGTGTGGAPVVAKIARELGILTVGIVTIPFSFEGKRRLLQAEEGIAEFKEHVDALLIISNDKLREAFGNLTVTDAFAKADDVLTTAARGIAEIITVTGYVNVDFEDVKTVLSDSGVAIMGTGIASGENRARTAVESALNSPLLNDSEIEGARHVLINITSGEKEVLMDEITEITEYVQDAAGNDSDIIWGNCRNENLKDELIVTIIATGFETAKLRKEKKVTVHVLDEKLREKPPVTSQMAFEKDADTDERHEMGIRLKNVDESQLEQEAAKGTDPMMNPSLFVQAAGPSDKIVEEEVTKRVIHELDLGDVTSDVVEKSAEEQDDLMDFSVESKTQEIPFTPSATTPSATDENLPENPQERPAYQTKAKDHLLVRTVLPDPEPTQVRDEAEQQWKTEERKRLERHRKDEERRNKLRSLSMRLGNLDEVENQPAYLRRKVELQNTPHSSEDPVSKFSLSDPAEGEDGNTEIRSNNKFLHDNVD